VTISLEDYRPTIGDEAVRELEVLARPLRGRRLVMVNSTRVGGGVAEMLARLVPLLIELGIDCRWEVLRGNPDFYRVTKSWHNALHGAPVHLTMHDVEVFVETNRQNAGTLDLDADVVAIHDPQPAALIEQRRPNDKRHWVWRCHIDVSAPAAGIWDFLSSFLCRYDAAIFSVPAFAQPLPLPQYLFYPSIDPLAEKNRDLASSEIDAILDRLGIPRDRDYLLQVSRYDRLKDPLGVIEAYRLIKRTADVGLVLAGGGADDDPEGAEVLEAVHEAADRDPHCHILLLPNDAHVEINALQRGAAVVLQKSLREGFGLTVTEGLWKARPVVASATGGIPLQILHGLTGLLVRSPEGCAYQVRYLLAHPEERERFGATGREWVREQFLITRNLKRWLLLLHALEHPDAQVIMPEAPGR
jgi:trehalose synthase